MVVAHHCVTSDVAGGRDHQQAFLGNNCHQLDIYELAAMYFSAAVENQFVFKKNVQWHFVRFWFCLPQRYTIKVTTNVEYIRDNQYENIFRGFVV